MVTSVALIGWLLALAGPALAQSSEEVCPAGDDKFEVNGDATGGSWQYGGSGITVEVDGSSADITLAAGVVIDSVCWKSGVQEEAPQYLSGPWIGPTTFSIETNSGQDLSHIVFWRGEYPPRDLAIAPTDIADTSAGGGLQITVGAILALLVLGAGGALVVRRRATR